VLQAIHVGQSPILQIVNTGSSKNLSFIIPAYCGIGGVTVVIVPLVALRDDIVRRCEEIHMKVLLWDGGKRPSAGGLDVSLVFVIPESFLMGGFGTFLTAL
jgi:superfamily II DNA helicase RecQ